MAHFFYEHQYESPIEEQFAYHLDKYIGDNTIVEPQFEINTPFKTFRIDFVIHLNGIYLGIECDGLNFHDKTYDDVRDTIIIGTSKIKSFLRFQWKLIHHQPVDCVFITKCFYPYLFSKGGTIILDKFASPYIQNATLFSTMPFLNIEYKPETNRPIDEDETCNIEDYDKEPDEIKYNDVFAEHKTFNPNRYYYYMYNIYWEIILHNGYKSFDEILNAFQDRVKLIDGYFKYYSSLDFKQQIEHDNILKEKERLLLS